MRTNMILAAAAIAALVGTAAAAPVTGGDVITGALEANTSTAQIAHFGAVSAGFGFDSDLGRSQAATGVSRNLSGAGRIDFGSYGSAQVLGQSGGNNTNNFYLGTAADLEAAQGGVWFNTLDPANLGSPSGNNADGLANIGGSTNVLGFANNANPGGNFSDNRIVINFNPGVQGFAFNFADIRDVANTVLEVQWRDQDSSSSDLLTAATITDRTGYFSLIADGDRQIERLILRQTPDQNDGFLVYGFTTLTVVPLPPAAWAGLAMLGGVAGVRKLRRRG